MELPTFWVALLGASVQFYDVNRIRTRVIEAGSGPPLVMIHGMGGHAENFAHNIMPLAQDHHVYAIDLLAHGLNSFDERETFFPDMLEHVVEFLNLIEAKRAALVGLSLGGMIAAWMSIRYPQRVDKLVLTTPFGLSATGDQQEIEAAFQRVREGNLRAVQTPTLEAIRERLRPLVHNPDFVTEEMVAVRRHVYTRPGAREAMTNFTENFYAQRWDYVLTPERLKIVPAETLLVWSKHNTPGVDAAQQMTRLMPHATLQVLENSGHWPHVEESEEYNRLVKGFLAG